MKASGFPLLGESLEDLLPTQIDRAEMIRPPDFMEKIRATAVLMNAKPFSEAECIESANEMAKTSLASYLYECFGRMGAN